MTATPPPPSERPPVDARAGLIRRLTSGVPGFDAVLGGGIPEFSFNLIAGGPGAGKTTLAQQMLFENATADRPGLYFTVLGEPTLKMIRYQRQFGFFAPDRLGRDVHLLNLGAEAGAGDLDAVLARIVDEVQHSREFREYTLCSVCFDAARRARVRRPGRRRRPRQEYGPMARGSNA